MGRDPNTDATGAEAVRVSRASGSGRFIVVCEHASNHVPAEFGTLGLSDHDLTRHIAWDPGARGVAESLSVLLDSPLVESCVSRLVIDCNRPLDAPDLIAETSETTDIPGNRGLNQVARARRIALAHTPFHQALHELIDARLAAGHPVCIVTVHSFTPVYRGVSRPWEIGIIHDSDQRISQPLIAALEAEGSLAVGDNEPYAPEDRVYYTLERHARSRGLPCVMIEIRNDEIATAEAEQAWAERLAPMLADAVKGLEAVRVAS